MEFEKVFMTVVMVSVGIIAIFGLIGSWDNYYSTNSVTEFNSTISHVNSFVSYDTSSIAISTSNSTVTPSGAGTTSANADLLSRALSIITFVPRMFETVQSLIQDTANILHMGDSPIVILFINLFLFTASILFAYLLIIGVRRLL